MPTSNGGNIKFGIQFQTNRSGLNEITKSLQQIQKQASTIKVNDQGFQKASKAAKQLQSIFNKSWNDKLGQLNLDKFNQSIKQSYNSVGQLKAVLSQAGASGQSAFNAMATQVLHTNLQLRQSNKILDSMATSMANTVKWGITSAIFNNITGSIEQAFNYAKNLNSSLNDIRIVTGDSADQMERFARVANDAAKELGRSTLDYTKAALSFYQQGLSDEQVQARTNVTLKAQNITGTGSQMVDYLTSVFNGFKVGAADTQGIVDKLAKVADSSASNMSQLAIAMSKVAATANVVGVDVDQLTAQLATVIATTRQAPEAVGTAFKSIYARINDIKTGADDAEISLGNYSGQMANLGFNVLDASGKLRDTGQVIEQIGSRWASLSKEQQISLAQIMGGQRQITQVVALFDNWTKYSELLNDSLTAQGTLNEKNDIYLQSTAAHMEQLQTELERTKAALFDMDTVNTFVDGIKEVVDIFNDFVEGIGGGTNAFVYFGSTVANLFSKQIGTAINTQLQNIELLKNNIAQVEAQQTWSQAAMDQTIVAHSQSGDNISQAALQKEVEIAQRTLEVRKALTQQQYNELQNLQQQVGIEQTRIDYLKQYKNISREILYDEQVTLPEIKARLDIETKTLNIQKEQHNVTASAIANYKLYVGQVTEERNTRKDLLNIIQESINREIRKKQLSQILEKISKGQELTQNQINKILGLQTNEMKKQQELVNQVKQAYEGKKAVQSGELKELEEQTAARKRIITQQQDSAARELNIQKGVRATTSIVQGLSAAIGGISTALDQSSTTAERLEGGFSALSGSAAAIANYFMPGSGFIVQGIAGILKETLKLSGAWEALEDTFKTSKEKVQDLKKAVQELNESAKGEGHKISSLESIQEQYEALSAKAGQYGSTIDRLTEEEQARYHELTNTFAQYNQAVIVGYDEQGNAIVKGQEALLQTIEVLKEARKEAERAALGSKEQALGKLNAGHSKQEKLKVLNVAKEDQMRTEASLRNIVDDSSLTDRIEEYSNSVDQAIRQLNSSGKEAKLALENAITTDGQNLTDVINQYHELKQEVLVSLYQGQEVDEQKMEKYLSLSGSIADVLKNNKYISNGENLSYLYNLLKADEDQIQGIVNEVISEKQKVVNNLQEKYDQNQNYNAEQARYLIGIMSAYEEEGDGYNLLMQARQKTGIQNSVLETLLSSYIQTLDDSKTPDQVFEAVENYAANLATALTQGQQAINKAIEKLTEDDLKQENIGQSYEKRLERIKDSIKEVLKNVDTSAFSAETKAAFEDYLKQSFGLNDLKINFESGQIKEVKTAVDDAIEELKSGVFDNIDIFPGAEVWLKANFDDSQILQIVSSIEDSEASFEKLPEFQQYVRNLFKELEREDVSQKVVQNFDKIESAINKLSSGKNLSWKEKLNLKQLLSIEDLSALQTRQDWLEKIKESIFEMPSDEEHIQIKLQGIVDLFDSLGELNQSKQALNLSDQQFALVSQGIFEKEADAAKADIQILQDYAHVKGMAFESVQDQEKVLDLYTRQNQAMDDYEKAIQNVINATTQYDDSRVILKSAFQDVQKVKQVWEELTGLDVSTDWIVANIGAISLAAQTGITNLQILNSLITAGYTNEASNLYAQAKMDSAAGETAAKNLESGSVTEADAQRLQEMQSEWEELQKIAETYGRDSESYLQMVQRINEAEKNHIETTKQARLQEIDSNRKILQYRMQLLEKAKESATSEEKINELEEKRLQFQEESNRLASEKTNLEMQGPATQKFELDSDINTEAFEQFKDYIKDNVEVLEQFDDALNQNENALNEVTSDILRFDAAAKKVTKSYDKWMDALNSGGVLETAQAISELQDTYSDLIGMPTDVLSDSFMRNTQNLQLMRQAIEGNEDAYNQLLERAQQDIETQCHITMDDEEFWNAKGQIQNAMEQMQFENLQIGADLNIDGFLGKLETLVNAADMTAKQAEAYLASMGIDAEVVQDTSKGESVTQETDWTPVATPEPLDYSVWYQPEPNGPLYHQQAVGSVEGVNWSNEPREGKNKVEQKSFALKVKSAHKSSGGDIKHSYSSGGSGGSSAPRSSGGGGGRGSSPKTKTKAKKTTKAGTAKSASKIDQHQKDVFYYLNNTIKKLSHQYDQLEKQRTKFAKSDDIKKNLQKELDILQKELNAYKQKLQLQKQEKQNTKKKLQDLAYYQTYLKKGNHFSQGDKVSLFDAEGNLSGIEYDNLLTNWTTVYNTAVDDYEADLAKRKKIRKEGKLNARDEREFKARYNQLENLKDQIDKAKDLKDKFDDLTDGIYDSEDAIEDLKDSLTDKRIEKFKIEIEASLEIKQAQKTFNEFKRKVIKGLKDYDILGSNKTRIEDIQAEYKVLDDLQNHVMQTRQELSKINYGYTGDIYGKNAQQAKEDLQNYTNELMTSLTDITELTEEVQNAVYDIIDKGQEAYDYQTNQLDVISGLLDHNLNVVTMLYGEDNYAAMAGYYKLQEEKNLQLVDDQKKQTDFWYQRMQAQRKVMNGIKDTSSTAWQEANKLFQAYEEHWQTSVQNLNAYVEQSLQNIVDKYSNSIRKIFDDLTRDFSSSKMSLSSLSEEWQLIKEESQMYLDNINAAFELEKLENAYKQAINDSEGNLSAQKSLNDMMEEELKFLREKDKLSQYDVDRANALLNIEVKRLALQQARQSKTKLRLRRDTQGNYSYQYVSDQKDIQNAQQQLISAQNELYNKTKQAYTNNIDSFYSYYNQMQEKIIEIQTNTALQDEEKQRLIADTREKYNNIMSSIVADHAKYQQHLIEETVITSEMLYGEDEANFTSKTHNEQVKAYWLASQQVSAEELANQGLKAIYSMNEGNFKESQDKLQRFVENYEKWKVELSDNTVNELNHDYGQNLASFKNMVNGTSSNDGMVNIFSNGIGDMIVKITGKGGFNEVMKSAFDAIKKESNQYDKDLEALAKKAGTNWQTVKNAMEKVGTEGNKVNSVTSEYIKLLGSTTDKSTLNSAVDTLNSTTGKLVQNFKKEYDTLTGPNGLLTQLTNMKNSYSNIEEAAKNAAIQANKLLGIDTSGAIITKSNTGSTTSSGGGSTPTPAQQAEINRKREQEQRKQEQAAAKQRHLQELENELKNQINRYNSILNEKSTLNKTLAMGKTNSTGKGVNILGQIAEYDAILNNCSKKIEDIKKQITNSGGTIVGWTQNKNTQKLSFSKISYDTGGYTGSWGDYGRLALLHEKELVLNKEDTKNFLSAIEIVRSLSDELKFLHQGLVPSSNLLFGTNSTSQVQQHVSIEAHFPNVSNSNEIETAFNNLINKASQYVLKT